MTQGWDCLKGWSALVCTRPQAVKWLRAQIAINQEVLVAVCGPELGLPGGLVNLWGQAVQQAKVSNTVVAAVDPGCLRSAEQLGMAAYQANLQVALYSCCCGLNIVASRMGKFYVPHLSPPPPPPPHTRTSVCERERSVPSTSHVYGELCVFIFRLSNMAGSLC